ncbi:uncharacterized protein LOC124846608 [Vigna umbellata]|uniref:uncharacterized protein LOC124846608 n=1 Tax=Vigna umbellata TaxID=87088 RepID=UPI001F5F1EEC|nr:uncharacterized protein LOC124846608 [Vigna umbellata]
MEIFKKLEMNIPFSEALQQMPSYAKFLKELLTKKRKYIVEETIEVQGNCSAIIQKLLPPKYKDPGSFTIPCTIGNISVGKALIDLGASINLVPLSMPLYKKIKGLELKPTRMTLPLADRSLKYPYGVAEDVLVKVDKFLLPMDFVIMDMEEDVNVPLILGRPFMNTARVLIDVENGKLKEILVDTFEELNETEEELTNECLTDLKELKKDPLQNTDEKAKESKKELKMLPPHLKYVFLEESGNKPVIISNSLSPKEEEKLVEILKVNKGAIGWSISNLKGVSPNFL